MSNVEIKQYDPKEIEKLHAEIDALKNMVNGIMKHRNPIKNREDFTEEELAKIRRERILESKRRYYQRNKEKIKQTSKLHYVNKKKKQEEEL